MHSKTYIVNVIAGVGQKNLNILSFIFEKFLPAVNFPNIFIWSKENVNGKFT